MDNIRRELRDSQGFTWVNWRDAAEYALENKRNLEEARGWAQRAVSDPFSGNENFQTLTTLAQLQMATAQDAEAAKTVDRAMAMGSSPTQVHQFARQLQRQGRPQQAMTVFRANAKRNPGKWPTTLGLARGYSELGDTKNALAMAKKAVAEAPDEPNRKNVERFIQTLEAKLNPSAAN